MPTNINHQMEDMLFIEGRLKQFNQELSKQKILPMAPNESRADYDKRKVKDSEKVTAEIQKAKLDFLKKISEEIKQKGDKAALANVMSLAINRTKFFDDVETESVNKKIAGKLTRAPLPFKYDSKAALTKEQEVALKETQSTHSDNLRAGAQHAIDAKHRAESERVATAKSKSMSIDVTLNNYLAKLGRSKTENGGKLTSGNILGKSDQESKEKIANRLKEMLESNIPSATPKTLPIVLEELKKLIDKNKKATGKLHSKSDLHDILVQAEKRACKNVPNGEAIYELTQYIRDAQAKGADKKEPGLGMFTSDQKGKLDLAIEVRNSLMKIGAPLNTTSTKNLEGLIHKNKGLTESNYGIHKAGKLEGIFTKMLDNAAKTPTQKKTPGK